MRLLAIGDVHGCLTALDTLLATVNPGPEDQIVTLGDYVDRGPNSRGVVDRLIELTARGNLIPLRGNHDEMMLDARQGRDWSMWVSCGGKEALRSYGHFFPHDKDVSRVPERHWVFLLHDCRDWYETDRYLFVHAIVDAHLPVADQPLELLHWSKLYEPIVHCSGKVVVCGHTRQPSGLPLNWGTTICIDTGVYDRDGWLTCLDVHTGEYWQANQRGETRKGQLGELDPV
jgi:serine/threonine protein phosphatase 1